MIRIYTFSLIVCVSYCFPYAWIPAAQGIGRRGNWHPIGDHPWARSGMAARNEKRRINDYDLFDGIQGDDPTLWLGEDESAELKDLEFEIIKVTTQPPPITDWFEEESALVPTTESYSATLTPRSTTLIEEEFMTTEDAKQVITDATNPPRTRARDGEWDSVERYFLHKAATPLNKETVIESDLDLKMASSEEFDNTRISRKTDVSRHGIGVPDSNGLSEVFETSSSPNKFTRNALKVADQKPTDVTSINSKYLFTRKPQVQKNVTLKPASNRAFEVELHAAETIKRKLFRNNTRHRQNYLAPIDMVELRRKNLKEDRDVAQLSKPQDIEDAKLFDPVSIYYPVENTISDNENPVEQVLRAVIRDRRPQVVRQTLSPTTETESITEGTTQYPEVTEEPATELPPSLADLFPTIPPPKASPRKSTQPPKRGTRLPFYIKQQIVANTNRRGRGREIILPPDYSPLPYGIDYRLYDGPRSLFSKLRFQSDSNDQLTTTIKPITFHVPDLEVSDTGKLNEVYRFVGRKPPTTIQKNIEVSSTPTSASQAFASFINFFKSLIGKTTTPMPDIHY